MRIIGLYGYAYAYEVALTLQVGPGTPSYTEDVPYLFRPVHLCKPKSSINCLGLNLKPALITNQLEKNMDNSMQTVGTQGFMGVSAHSMILNVMGRLMAPDI